MTLKEAIEILKSAGIESADYDARELFRFYRPGAVMLNTECDSPELIRAIERRAKREPLQYIIGEVGFYRESYLVTPDCLIPRPDTEILVDYAVHNLPEGACFMDLCTGSGCVAISTLKNTVNTTAVAIDISGGALAVATENALKNGVSHRINFQLADLTKEVVALPVFAVLSNPPYVADSVYEGLAEEIYHEPREAFVGGSDGGDFYRRLTPIYKDFIDKEGFIAYEIGYDQADLLREIAKECHMSCKILKDLSGNDRVAVLKMQNAECRMQN